MGKKKSHKKHSKIKESEILLLVAILNLLWSVLDLIQD